MGIKLLKQNPGASSPPLKISIPANCAGCAIMHGPFYEGQNGRETFFYLKVPVSISQLSGIKVDVGNLAVKAVVVEKSRLPFHRDGSVITFDAPVHPRDRSSTLEVQTSLEWPGLTVRIEHAFESRRAGAYAKGRWPALERQAALNLEFGLREAIRNLGLDQEVCQNGLGRIHLMGFDTNDPLGHEDYPPHIHLILRWPHFAGSQAPHFYITPEGMIDRDVKVTVDGLPDLGEIMFPGGKPVPAVDYLGEVLFISTVNPDGTLTLARPQSGTCTLRPVNQGSKGFASGVNVRCSEGNPLNIRAEDNTETGTLRVLVDAKPTEVYRYDPDTAVLKSSEPPLPSPSSAHCQGTGL